MPVTVADLKTKLTEKLTPSYLEVNDLSDGCGQNIEVIIVSTVFEGKSVLQKHRLVNDAIKSEIAEIHAFSQKTFTPIQWEQQK
ncbi:hypothetical protein HDV02_003695 [Globomyces sp. JEL0801]|nr:hypothetical protein HDV02_003695 [Globomyces sp. JEL0801]